MARYIEKLVILNTNVRFEKNGSTTVLDPDVLSEAFDMVKYINYPDEIKEVIEGKISGVNITVKTNKIFLISNNRSFEVKINDKIHQSLVDTGCKVNVQIKLEVLRKPNSNKAKAIRVISMEGESLFNTKSA